MTILLIELVNTKGGENMFKDYAKKEFLKRQQVEPKEKRAAGEGDPKTLVELTVGPAEQINNNLIQYIRSTSSSMVH